MQCTTCEKNQSTVPCRVCAQTKFCKNCSKFWSYQSKMITTYDRKLATNYEGYDLFMLPICKNCRKKELNKNLFRIIIMTYGIFNSALLILAGFMVILTFILILIFQSLKIKRDMNRLNEKKISFKDIKAYEIRTKKAFSKK